ncbi:MAG: tRNA (guanosine(37)-N1)-methyltransferase TrmD [Betaproteobacteria bacterium]|nr:tRNA (guanosine(37)-N1)-methyltransferase TrmD [Betaproteobacteria bacterium]NBT10109.1 tRNA (guanosine(37)-N1)-methyltransferase TrmD [Betaproteobacteria bacterium]NBU48971.1 tRNA (guanosine(37)-N1)-methyltransferase TrmD [Betaproteobacteria bacterium]NBX96312.1 tRNA (guanosine(37)-N1)-methyltransferase TrmD [Betaproteobacteria bacterium]
MPRFDVITLVPELFGPHLSLGVTRRAFESGAVQVRLWPLREHAQGPYRRVDDRPFGGGPGMVMLAEPLHQCIQAIRSDRGVHDGAPLIHFTPTGRPLTQSLVRELAQGPGALLLCGRYEGVDQRLLDRHRALDISVGDFVLSGGDLPALVLMDAVARLQPGVLHDPSSHEQDSFEGDGLLEGPHYSRPEVWPQGESAQAVPAVLVSGHHGDIQRWRRAQALEITARRRPDLIEAARAAGRLSADDEEVLAALYNRGF